jgi:tRNA A-37 threonylcarbamoyl transferase component Bud32
MLSFHLQRDHEQNGTSFLALSRMLECAAMPDVEPDSSSQSCPACGALIDVANEEPLARVECPGCGERFRVERTFDNFVLLETLGVGGMGSVYKARDTRLNRFVALKILRPELSDDPAEIRRLEHEARATAAVNDPHVVQVFSSGTDNGQFYLVMELVDHGSLDDRMAEQGRLPEAEVLDTGIQVARGLRAAHEKGLIHRDIKPGNILFGSEQTAKVGDFGLAVAAEQNTEAQNEIWGTPYYVAPERLNNEPEDFRSDLYSLGATLYHAIAGRPPFEGETNSASALRDLKNRPLSLGTAAPGLRRETVRVINRMVTPDPDQRFASYDELIEHLEQARDALNPSGKKAKRRRLAFAALAIAILLGGAALYLYKLQSDRLAKAAGLADQAGEETLRRLYDDARRELIAGKYDSARTTFTRLANEAQGKQPLLNWIRLHRGLANLLRAYTTQARQAFQELESAGPFSTKPEDAALANFFVDTARTMNAAEPVPAGAARPPNPQIPEAFALFLFAIKDWQQSDFPNAGELLEQFGRSNSAGAYSWINDYKPLAEKFLADYRVFADWQKQSQEFTRRDQITDGLTALRTAQGKLQLRGRLTEAFKEEEAKLIRRLEEKK